MCPTPPAGRPQRVAGGRRRAAFRKPSGDLSDAESRFDEHLAQNEYYAAGEIRPGQWIGTGAERTGLKNVATREQFQALCEKPLSGRNVCLRSNTAFFPWKIITITVCNGYRE
jgi:hypothetical protein